MLVPRSGWLITITLISIVCKAQQPAKEKVFTHADTLRGSITPERAWWNVLRYDITVKPDYDNKIITGKNIITYSAVRNNDQTAMQIDLKEPLTIDSILI